MAKFDIEFEKIILVEGGYSCDPDDAGGETYLGISRKAHPYWGGWKIIDKIKKQYGTKNITKRLKENDELTYLAKNIYKNDYWNIFELDDIPSQDIAHQMFDTAVNCGASRAIRIAQQVIGMTITGKWSEELKYNLMQYGKEN